MVAKHELKLTCWGFYLDKEVLMCLLSELMFSMWETILIEYIFTLNIIFWWYSLSISGAVVKQ